MFYNKNDNASIFPATDTKDHETEPEPQPDMCYWEPSLAEQHGACGPVL